jgi:hypothetical protein
MTQLRIESDFENVWFQSHAQIFRDDASDPPAKICSKKLKPFRAAQRLLAYEPRLKSDGQGLSPIEGGISSNLTYGLPSVQVVLWDAATHDLHLRRLQISMFKNLSIFALAIAETLRRIRPNKH